MKHKIGDIVRIKSIDWYEREKNEEGNIKAFVSSMSKYCGRNAEIMDIIRNNSYRIDIDGMSYAWADYMFDDTPQSNEDVLKEIADIIKRHHIDVEIVRCDGKQLIIEPITAEEGD